jgi:[ribosomal protein S18]-alanine N-acetyltransferase
MSVALKLRELRDADLGRVAEIERETFADPWSRRSLSETLRQDYVRGLALEDEGGALVAYGLCTIVEDEGEILNLAVLQSARRRGLGRQLLDGLLEALREAGVGKAFLEVRRSNEAAIALYRSAGFQPLGLRPGYYVSPREDALTMTLELGSQNRARK